jgi:hypothetical protein
MKYVIKNLTSKEQDKVRTAFFKSSKSKKDKAIIRKSHLNWIERKVVLGTGHTISELKELYSEENLFYVSLKHVTTTKKSLCKALLLDIDNCCRYKRDLEIGGLLIESIDSHTCNYSFHQAKLLSTNQAKFDELLMSNQLKFEFSYE